ncbi:MAG: nucleotidyltransferase domain-containing protein [Desulfitobacteriaceae bacterium]
MGIEKNDVLGGQPIFKVRELMKRGSWGPWNETLVGQVLDSDSADTNKLIQVLINEGFIERMTDPTGEVQFINTIKGNALGMASAAKPISRVTAEKKLKEFLKRVEIVNSNSEYCYFVNKVLLFGSFLTGANEVNDIDLAVELVNKEDFHRRHLDRINKALIDGRRFPNVVAQVCWPKEEVLRFLKARSRVFSIHDMDDQILDKVTSMVIYEQP